MNRNNKSLIILSSLLTLFLANPARAEQLLKDPIIPDGERIVYSFTLGKSSCTLVEEIRTIEEDNRRIYEITSRSEFVDKDAKIDRETMNLYYLCTTSKSEDTEIERRMTIKKDESPPEKNVIRMLGYYGLNYILRTIPFDSRESMRIEVSGSKNNFPLIVKVTKTEKIKIKDKDIKCYKVELGLGGFLGIVFPKSNFWYSYDFPNYLVKAVSPKSPMGYPRQVIELLEYTVVK